MGPDDLLLLVMITALTIYALFGGADFGAGVWEFTLALQSTDKEREHIYKAIGPVWEANHVWLIFVLVILMNGFPLAFATVSRALWFPLLLALCGIVFRGAAYAFRYYNRGKKAELVFWEAIFAAASTATPAFLGAAAGAIASGQLPITPTGEYQGDYLIGWISPLSVYTAFYAVGLCAYLAAVYLAREALIAEDQELFEVWRQRSLSTGLWIGVFSIGGLFMVWLEAPMLLDELVARGWPLVAISICCGLGSLILVWRRRIRQAVLASSGAVASVVLGWGVAQYPTIVPPTITSDLAKAPDNVLWMMLAVAAVGGVLLLPSLAYLFILFKSDIAQQQKPSRAGMNP